ncbi:hypothetical protein ACFL2V_15950 [Pseudomonadota bacterium]
MICPSCKEGTLLPRKIAEGLPALCCNHCNGQLISMLSYRMWVESQAEMPEASADIEPLSETANALACPKCQKLMSKYRISGHTANKLDSCGSCGELWADDGEWQLLHILGLTDKVSSILTQPWQHAIKQ